MKRRNPDAPRIFAAVAPKVERAARRAAADLTAKGVPHALIGRLAVNAYARPRNTNDADFLVPADNVLFREHGLRSATLTVEGIDVDLLAPPPRVRRIFEAAIRAATIIERLPVLAPEYVAFLKLWRGFMNDRADVTELVKHDALPLGRIRSLVEAFGTHEMAAKLEHAIKEARSESRAH